MMKIKEVLKRIYYLWIGYDYTKGLLSHSEVYLYNIWSYCQNEFLLKNDVGLLNSERYGYLKKIHNLLKVEELVNGSLERIGNDIDGGYVMARKEGDWLYSRKKIAYSLGINTDVTWDKSMAKGGYQVYQYDHTIKHLPEKHPNFYWGKIGIADGEETKELKKLDTLMKKNGHLDIDGLILKADIEGFEWGMFDTLSVERIGQFDQIVVEMHDFVSSTSNQQKKIVRVLEKLNRTHQAVHIHANNNGIVEYCGDLMLPQVLEVTFVKKSLFITKSANKMFPTNIDRRNTLEIQDIMIGHWNFEDRIKQS